MSRSTAKSSPLVIGDETFKRGDRGTVHLPVGHLITHEMVELTVHVRRGSEPGPRLLLTAALHGDEINGVEAIRRVLRLKMKKLRGDLIAVPVVNLPAFLGRSRYLPDRRDLNRLFPGSSSGSFGARLARTLFQDIARQCTHAIDLHTGSRNRPNLPQVRYTGAVTGSKEMAAAFRAPVIMDSPVRSGTFRGVFSSMGRPQILYEGGEAQIMEPSPVKVAMKGVLSVMRYLEMLPPPKNPSDQPESAVCHDSFWERSPRGGLFLPSVDLGSVVRKGDSLGKVADPFSTKKTSVKSTHEGVIIGRAKHAVIDEGDGIFHVGLTECLDCVVDSIEATEAELDHRLDHPVFDDPLAD